MEQWQMWSLQRTENPKELDRNQPAPQNRVVAQLVVYLVWDQDVAGSSPVYPTKYRSVDKR